LSKDEYVIVLVLEHVVFDGWSEDVLLKELALHYKAFSTDTVPVLPELPIQYVDYANWLRGRMQGEVRNKLVSYWRRQLEGHDPFPEFELPMARPRSAEGRLEGASQQLLISRELTQALRDLGREKGVTLFMTLLAALKVVFHRYTGRDSIGVLTPTVNRNQPETQDLIGWFSNLLVLRTDLSGNPTFVELLRRVREVLLGALTHEELPLSELITELREPRAEPLPPAITPYVFFTLIKERRSAPINSWMQSLQLSDVRIKQLSVDFGDTAPGLSIQVREKAEMLEITLRYETQCYDELDIISLLDDLKIALESIVANPECRLSDWVASRVEQDLQMAQCP
jgi:hypothetical protein